MALTKIVVYIDYTVTISIIRQLTLTSLSTNKFNLPLVRVLEVFSRFDLNIRYKPDKEYEVLNILL